MSVPLVHLGRIDSTQSFLERHPELFPCGVLADCQEAGRGRRGNRWESAPGAGLWLSAALPLPPVPPGVLLQRAMGAVAEALEPAGVALGLKWPNDLVAWKDGRLVKLGGIIGQVKGARVILGAGVNLLDAPELPERAIAPAHLAAVAADPRALPGTLELARAVLDAWEDLETHREPAFRWPESGDRIQWEEGHGVCAGWMEDGRLAMDTTEGRLELVAGDVSGLSDGRA